MTNQQGAPEALRLADLLLISGALPGSVSECAGIELRRLHAENERLQQELIRESHRTAEQKLRADQMTRQHADQAAMNREARAQLAALVEAQQPAPSAAAVVGDKQKESEMKVWFRPARMHGQPERTPIKATITKDRGNGIVDLTFDDEGVSGNARAVPNALRLPRNVREQVAVWWDVGFEMDFQTAVENSLGKKKDSSPQPSPTPQADSQPAPEYVGNGMFKGETIQKAAEHWANWCDVRSIGGVAEFLRVVAATPAFWTPEEIAAAKESAKKFEPWLADADRAARAPADSVTAPAGGAVAGPILAPSAFVNAAGIKADDKPGTVVRKLDAAFHDAVTFADAAQQGDARLWCVHVQGPDDVIAMPSKSAALEHANDLNALFGRHPYEEGDPIMRAVVIEWPHSAGIHAADLVIQDATHGAAPTPPAQAADSVLEDAERWNEVLMHVGAAYHLGGQHFTLNTLRIRDQMYLLRGSVAQHFTACIDDSRAARKQGANHD